MLKCRLIEENGTRAWLRIYWGSTECGGSYHNARSLLCETDDKEAWDLGGSVEDHAGGDWPTRCDRCGIPVPESRSEVKRQVFRTRRYSTGSGEPEPGDMFWTTWRHEPFSDGTIASCEWDNCEGRHLYVVLPNGQRWDTDSRASNCTRKRDRTHRCWVRHGTPPNITVDKQGDTCAAGAGSISVPGYHGFLKNGHLT